LIVVYENYRGENSADPRKNSSVQQQHSCAVYRTIGPAATYSHTKRADLFPINIRPEGYVLYGHTHESAALSFFSFHFILFFIISDGWHGHYSLTFRSFYIFFVKKKKKKKKGKLRRVEESITSRDRRETHRKLMRLGSPFQSSCRKKDDGGKERKEEEGGHKELCYIYAEFLLRFFRGFFGIYFFSVVGYTKQEKEEEEKYKTGRKETS